MLKDFLSALLLEILRSLQTDDDFKGPQVFKDYLKGVKEKDLLNDLRLILQMINATDFATLHLKDSALFKAILYFFSENFVPKLDELGCRFYLLPYEQRCEKAKGLISSNSYTAAALRDLMVHHSHQEITEILEQLAKSVADAPTIVVQTPRDISMELKKEMRKQCAERFPSSFPYFQINRQLIGGFRIFMDSRSYDHSWFARLQKLTSLTARAAGAHGLL